MTLGAVCVFEIQIEGFRWEFHGLGVEKCVAGSAVKGNNARNGSCDVENVQQVSQEKLKCDALFAVVNALTIKCSTFLDSTLKV